jgi:hypothetical protein
VDVTPGDNNWSWEQDETVFAVFFWELRGGSSWAEDMHELRSCDLLEAMRWAEDHAGPRPWALAAIVDDPTESAGNERGVVWLLGRDLNAPPGTDAERDVEHRMHGRVGQRVLADGAR